jgi:hypothetical protein
MNLMRLLAVVLLPVLAACSDGQTDAQQAALIHEAMQSKVRYEVTGTTDMASLTYETPTGTSQQSDIDIPMTIKDTGAHYLELTFQSGAFVYISAQNSEDTGSVTCRITTDSGDVIAENTASGAYAIATCKGTAP